MTKAELTNGTKIFVLKIEQFVSLSSFTKALGNHFYDLISEKLEKMIIYCDYATPSDWKFDDEKFKSEVDVLIKEMIKTEKLTKRKVEKILKDSLRLYGREGSKEDGMFEASYERGEALNKCYSTAREWITNKYPHLKPNEDEE